MGKEAEIARLLSEGATPVEVIALGYARSTAHKVASRLRAESARGNGAAETSGDPDIENDPEIMKLKKAIRKAQLELEKAQLERELEEIKGPSTMESLLADLKTRLADLEGKFGHDSYLLGELIDFVCDYLAPQVYDCPLSGMRSRFECSCGAKGLVAAKVVCTWCNEETSFGWWRERDRLD